MTVLSLRKVGRRALVSAGWIALLLAGATLAGSLWSARIPVPRHAARVPHDEGLWRGAWHVHTALSFDGVGTLDEVARDARGAGLSWVVVTEHNREDIPPPEYRNGVLLVFSAEATTRKGHVAALDLRRGLSREERLSAAPLRLLRERGALPVAAHPSNRARPFLDLGNPDLAGLEMLSLDDAFREALVSPRRAVPAMLMYPGNPVQAVAGLVRRPEATLLRFDSLLRERRVFGLCAVDAHGRPAYSSVFPVVSNYARVGSAPTGDPTADARSLVAALSAGRSFCAVDALAPGGGFRFDASLDHGLTASMGDEVPLAARPRLRIRLQQEPPPPGVEAALVCGGTPVPLQTKDGTAFEYMPERPGACRAEVTLGTSGQARIWILSNPIFVH